jgi:serine/threonine-protein kinase HipA
VPKRKPLGVWLYGLRVAELSSARPGQVVCRYTDEALARWPANTPLLSCSLPLGPRPLQAGNFFRGLLPEGRALQALAADANLASYDTFGLLERYGRDVAGAVIVAEQFPGPRPEGVEAYSEETLAAEVANLPERPLAIHDDSELSLAGLADELLLVEMAPGLWGRPLHGRPSTHILKVEDRRYPGMAEMEVACLRLARAVGLTSVNATTRAIGGIPCLIVSRFDRRVVGGDVVRLHQEDSCQALGRDAEADRGRGKYEASGGPRLAEIAALLDRYATDARQELMKLAAAVAFTLLIGNADAHGKNLGFVHGAPGEVQLAPLYDTVPTALWPQLRKTAAMSVNGRNRMATITIGDIEAEARDWPLRPEDARLASTTTVEALLAVQAKGEIPGTLSLFVEQRAKRLLRA